MDLKDLFLEQIIDELEKPLEEYDYIIQKSIHQWPDLVFDICCLLKRKTFNLEYAFKLPCGSGALELKRSKISNKLSVKYLEIKEYSKQVRFKSLLMAVYQDIEEESFVEKNINEFK